ncbi:MAG: M56 family metallopeptidase [Tunicatimonas sp.]|uniref:M56 family metallopeptidase n=1 Tax=Tunicatimonas sp. TaxID=1940096 RepID=UPI003C718BF5
MNFFTEHPLFSTAAEALGITILHSLWQGFLSLFLLALFLRFGKAKQPNTRFTVAFATLLIFLAAFGGTLCQQWIDLAPTPVITHSTEFPAETISVSSSSLAQTALKPTTVVESSSNWETGLTRLTQLAPWLAWLWVVGSFIFGLRLVNGLVQSQRLRYRTQPIPANWQQRVKKLSQRLGINQAVSYASTNRSNTPLTLGWIKPIILIPTSLLTMMPADQLEAIFIHELAHIKRRDYLWNLIQSVAEIILFYHPAYWYISSVLERERELACDKLTINVTQRPRVYAQALLQVATQATQIPLQSVAASGKRGLSDRIQQIIYPGRAQRGISVAPFIMLLSVVSLSLVAFSWYQPDFNQVENDLRLPDFIGYGQRYNFAVTLPSELASYSREDYLIGQKDFTQRVSNSWKYFRESTVYMLNGEVVENPESIRMKTIRRYEVYYDPIPPSLQNLTDQNYSAVVRAFTNDYPVAKKPFVVIGQITTRDGREYQPVPNIKVEVKESGKQTFTDTSGSFQLPATHKGSLIVHWPDRNPEEIAIEGREYHSLITYSRKDRLEKYRDKLQKRLIERMSEAALEEDRKAIQREINKLDNAINSLQRNDTDTILTKTITGRVMDAFANQGIEGVFIKATDGTIAVTDEKGYYQIYLPAQTTNTEFEVTHPDFPTQHTEVDASVQKAVYLSLFKEENRLVITGERIGQLEADSSVYQDLQVRFLYDPENNTMRLLSEAELLNDTVNKDGFYTIDDPGTLFTLDDTPVDPRTIPVDSVAFTMWDNQNVPANYNFVIRAYTEEETPEEKLLFILDGQLRKDIRSFDDVEALNLNIKSTETSKGDRQWQNLPAEYRERGYTKLVRIITREFNGYIADRTVQGKLVATGSGEPLVGAKISGLRNGEKFLLTRTDEHGEYKVTLPEDVEKVEYFYPGYSSIVIVDRRLLQSFPMAWTLHLKKEELPDKAPTFNKQLFVSPNPGSDEINVRFALDKPNGVKLELLNKEGTVLHSEGHRYLDAGSKEAAISTARFPADVYLLRVTVDNFSITRRIILK